MLLLWLLALFSLLHCIGLSPPWRRQSYRHRSCWCIGCIILFAGVIGVGTGIVVVLLLVVVVVVVVACPLCSVWQGSIMQRVYVFLTRNTKCYLPLGCLLARIRCNMSCAGFRGKGHKLHCAFRRYVALCALQLKRSIAGTVKCAVCLPNCCQWLVACGLALSISFIKRPPRGAAIDSGAARALLRSWVAQAA